MNEDQKQEEAFTKGYERARLEMFRELEQLICFYNSNNKKAGVEALINVRTALRAMKPYQKPWNIDAT